jgi:four helix bundle protein
MQNDRQDLSERLLEFGANVIRLTTKLIRTATGRHIANQLMRAATSAGANYQEACAAESKADFVHKLQIVLKELRESHYWLKLLERVGVSSDIQLSSLLKESDELVKIIAKSVITAKGRVR